MPERSPGHTGQQLGHLAPCPALGEAFEVLAACIHQRDDHGSQMLAEDERARHRQCRHDVQPEFTTPHADNYLDEQRQQDGKRGAAPNPSCDLTIPGSLRRQATKKPKQGYAHHRGSQDPVQPSLVRPHRGPASRGSTSGQSVSGGVFNDAIVHCSSVPSDSLLSSEFRGDREAHDTSCGSFRLSR